MPARPNKVKKKIRLVSKKRARYLKVFSEFRRTSPDMFAEFDILLARLLELNVKYLQVMVDDLTKKGYIPPWSGEYHEALIQRATYKIIEKTLLK